jgi:hypothetical protein
MEWVDLILIVKEEAVHQRVVELPVHHMIRIQHNQLLGLLLTEEMEGLLVFQHIMVELAVGLVISAVVAVLVAVLLKAEAAVVLHGHMRHVPIRYIFQV